MMMNPCEVLQTKSGNIVLKFSKEALADAVRWSSKLSHTVKEGNVSTCYSSEVADIEAWSEAVFETLFHANTSYGLIGRFLDAVTRETADDNIHYPERVGLKLASDPEYRKHIDELWAAAEDDDGRIDDGTLLDD